MNYSSRHDISEKTANVGIEHQSINGERRRFIIKTSVGFSYGEFVLNICINISFQRVK